MKQGVEWPWKRVALSNWFIGLLLLSPSAAWAAPRPPVFPPPEPSLNMFRFDATNWAEPPLGQPVVAAGVQFVESWSGYAVFLGGDDPALLQFPALNPLGRANISPDSGCVRFWYSPAWASTNLGGSGPGTVARLLEIGAWTPEARFGWWSVYLNPEGTGLFFGGQGDGQSRTFAAAPIAWAAQDWHMIAVAYTPQASEIYVDGQLVARGDGVTVGPDDLTVLTYGFTVGGTLSRDHLMQGSMDELTTFSHPCGASAIAAAYQSALRQVVLGPIPAGGTDALPQSRALARGSTAQTDGLLPPGGGGSGATNDWPVTLPSWANGGCNLGAVLIPVLTNGSNLLLTFCGRADGVTYDLAFATNLATATNAVSAPNWAPPVYWDWLAEIPPGTSTDSYLIQNPYNPTNITQPTRFFRLFKALDLNHLTPSYYVAPYYLPGADGSKDLPFPNLKTALESATNGAVIQVGPGLYQGATNADLSFGGKQLTLVSERGWEQTALDCTGATNGRAFRFGSPAENRGAVVAGFTISNARTGAVWCAGGSSPTFANCAFLANSNQSDGGGAFYCTNCSPMIVNCRFGSNVASTYGGAIYARGSNCLVEVSHSTFSDNRRPSGGGTLCATNGAWMILNNSIVWTYTTSWGNEIITNGCREVAARFCDIRGSSAWPGSHNTNSTPSFEPGGSLRLTLTNNDAIIDHGTTDSFPGVRWITRYDMDGEARVTLQSNTYDPGAPDIGADEFVYRIPFPTVTQGVWVANPSGGWTSNNLVVSEVDEASGVACLGNNSTGPLIAIVDDEDGANFHIYQLNGTATGVSQSYAPNLNPDLADMEGLTFDPATTNLYLLTSQTKRNRYRNVHCSPPILDPVVDPPSSDYQRKRNALVQMRLAGSLTTVMSANTFRSENVDYPYTVAYDPTNGLVGYMRLHLSNNPALGPTNFGYPVLIASNSVNKFGTPSNGTSYSAGTALPYAGGGPTNNAGVVIAALNLTSGAGSFTNTGTTSGGTYFYKIWAVGSATNYYPGPVVGVTNDGLPRVVINEFYAAGNTNSDWDWIEFFNPGPVAVDLGGIEISPSGSSGPFRSLPSGTNVPPKGFLRLWPNGRTGATNLPFDLNATAGTITLRRAYDSLTISVYPYTNEISTTTEGLAWDGGPRGFVSETNPCAGARFTNNSSFPPTPGTSNDTSAVKLFTAIPALSGTSVYLAWQNIGYLPAVWSYSPKQHDFHAMNVEDLAFRSTNEMIIGLRAPLVNRTNGNAFYFAVTNLSAFLPGSGWSNAASGVIGPYQLDLGGLGIRSIKWCPQLGSNPTGRYLVLAGTANGGPLQQEQLRQKFSLYSWPGPGSSPTKLIDDLSSYTLRPEGVDLMSVLGTPRVLFVEDRYQATGYGTRNAVHWPTNILGNIP